MKKFLTPPPYFRFIFLYLPPATTCTWTESLYLWRKKLFSIFRDSILFCFFLLSGKGGGTTLITFFFNFFIPSIWFRVVEKDVEPPKVVLYYTEKSLGGVCGVIGGKREQYNIRRVCLCASSSISHPSSWLFFISIEPSRYIKCTCRKGASEKRRRRLFYAFI